MKSYKCKGSFLIDSMAGFLLIGLITLLLIPMMNQMQASINHKLQTIDASNLCYFKKYHFLSKDMYTVLMSKLFRSLKC